VEALMGKRSSGPDRKVRLASREKGDAQYERRLQEQARLYNERTGRELPPSALRGFSHFEPLVPPGDRRDEGGGKD
jgi:hypothetical protein